MSSMEESMHEIRELKDDLYAIIPLLQVLNHNNERGLLEARLKMMLEFGYRCVGYYIDGKLVGICGFWILCKYYVGKHVEPDNMVFYPEYRGSGYGGRLIEWLLSLAKSEGCIASELNCYLPNDSGQRFWEKHGFRKIAHHYQSNFSV